jgi:hypothetical protein
LEWGLALALTCLRRSLAALLARDGGAAVCSVGRRRRTLGWLRARFEEDAA